MILAIILIVFAVLALGVILGTTWQSLQPSEESGLPAGLSRSMSKRSATWSIPTRTSICATDCLRRNFSASSECACALRLRTYG